MREDIYKEYLKEHPEELIEIGQLFARSGAIEARRAVLRQREQARINEWKEILNGDNHTRRDQ